MHALVSIPKRETMLEADRSESEVGSTTFEIYLFGKLC
jgi:hypothetical protein